MAAWVIIIVLLAIAAGVGYYLCNKKPETQQKDDASSMGNKKGVKVKVGKKMVAIPKSEFFEKDKSSLMVVKSSKTSTGDTKSRVSFETVNSSHKLFQANREKDHIKIKMEDIARLELPKLALPPKSTIFGLEKSGLKSTSYGTR